MKHATERERRAIAIHTAGHAVAAMQYKIDFEAITIKPGQDSFGPVLTYPKQSSSEFSPERYMIDLQRRIVVAYAGGVAEELLTGRINEAATRGDYRTATNFGMTAYSSDPATARAFLRSLMLWTRRLLQSSTDRGQIQAIAAALLDRETLTAIDVRRIALTIQSGRLSSALPE